jgi:putative ABC transport system permease protein
MYAKLAFRNIRRSIRDYAVYFLTLLFGVCIFYAFNSITQQSTVLDMSEAESNMVQVLSLLIGYVSVFVAIILGFLIVYANRFLIRRRKREFALYLTLGMRRRQVSLIIVLETVLVGLFSLVIGLALGYLLSQGLLFVTAALFDIKMDSFTFFFSPDSALKTVLCFLIMFGVTLVFNVVTISRYQLIDLLNAEHRNERLALRNPWISAVLLVVAVGMIAYAYHLLIENGLLTIDGEFGLSTLLVCAGTFLFFYSLSSILLRLIQKNRRFYLKGLNMFTMRQLANKVNTAWISMSFVTLTLFLALTASCTGFSIVSIFNGMLEKATPYDASYAVSLDGEANDDAAADGYDMAAALAARVSGWDDMVAHTAQIDMYEGDISFQSIVDVTDYTFSSSVSAELASENPVEVVPLSELNALRALSGLDPIELDENQFLIWCDYDTTIDFWTTYLSGSPTLTLYGQTFASASKTCDTTVTETAPMTMNAGVIVVSDDRIPAGGVPETSILDVMFNGSRTDVDARFEAAMTAFAEADAGSTDWLSGVTGMTATYVYDQNAGLTTIVSYLAIYIGVVLLIACAAMLALQQLSEAADNTERYRLIEKLGAEHKMMKRALYLQTSVYFVFPLVVAVAHSICAMTVVCGLLQLYGHIDITQPLIWTALLSAVVYGGYLLATCQLSRSMVFERR